MTLCFANLGDYVEIRTGKLDANAAVTGGDYPFFTCARENLSIDTYSYDCNAVLIAGNGDLNVKHYNGKFDAYQRTYIVVSKDEKKLDTRYLFHFMDKYVEKLREQSIGGVIKYIKLGMLTDAKIPLPEVKEQKRIAAILDKADSIRRKRQQAIAMADEFLRSVFLDMFGDPVTNPKGWEVRPLGELVENHDGKRIPVKSSDRKMKTGRYPYYGASGIIDYVESYIFESENLLIGEDGANLLARSTPLAFIADGKYWVNNHAHVLGENGKAKLKFLEFNINNRSIKDYVTGSAQPKLNQEQMNRIPVALPPLKLQEKFDAIARRSTKLINQVNGFKDNPSMLFSSISQKAFAGDL